MRSILTALVATLAVACAKNDGRTPFESAVSRSVTSLHESIRDGRRAANTSGPFELFVRYNPAACGCPPHEVYARGSWHRVFVKQPEGEDALATLQNGDPLAVASVRGEFTEERKTGDDGVAYPVFVIR